MDASAGDLLQPLVDEAQAQLEAALRGASLCAVSRDPHHGTSQVKVQEGRWYTLKDLLRDLDNGSTPTAAIAAAEQRLSTRVPGGETWLDYRAGAVQAVADARSLWGIGGSAV